MTADPRYLRIYLNDHLAGAAGGIALARRCRGSNPGPPLGPMLSALIEELRVDKRLVESVLAAHGLRPSKAKQAGALAAERVGRLKLNGSLRSYSPLSRLVELEGLRTGILAKRALWETLLSLDDLMVDRATVEEAAARADSQLSRVEEARRDAARLAFSSDSAQHV